MLNGVHHVMGQFLDRIGRGCDQRMFVGHVRMRLRKASARFFIRPLTGRPRCSCLDKLQSAVAQIGDDMRPVERGPFLRGERSRSESRCWFFFGRKRRRNESRCWIGRFVSGHVGIRQTGRRAVTSGNIGIGKSGCGHLLRIPGAFVVADAGLAVDDALVSGLVFSGCLRPFANVGALLFSHQPIHTNKLPAGGKPTVSVCVLGFKSGI